MKRFNLLPFAIAMGTPMIAFAQDLNNSLDVIANLLNDVIPILMVLATIVFIIGIIKYIMAGGDEDGVSSAKWYMLWSIIALFVMVSVWGIVGILIDTFNVGGTGIPSGPGAQ